MSEKIDQNLVSKAKSEFPEYDSQLAYKVPQEFLSDEEIYKLILDAAISLYKQAVSNSDFFFIFLTPLQSLILIS